MGCTGPPSPATPSSRPTSRLTPTPGQPPGPGLWAYTRTLHRGAAEALKTAISNHQGLVHTPHDNTQKGYTLWWHHPAPEGGLQPPTNQPGISPDITAVVHAIAAIAQQVGAPPQWAPSVIKETAARHNRALAHFRGCPIHPPLPDLDLPAHDAWAVHILVPHNTAPETGDARARVTKQLPNTALHYDIPTPNVIVTHNTGRDRSTSTPRRTAPPSPYTPSPPTLASSHHSTRIWHGSIHYTSPGTHAKGPPTTRPLPPTAPPSTQRADRPRHNTKKTYSHALALDPAPSPRPPTKVP